MAERSADDIQRDIERSRAELADAVDKLAYRTSPKRVVESTKQSLREKAQSPAGKAVIGATGGVVTLLVVVRVRRAVANSKAKKAKALPKPKKLRGKK